MNNVILVTGFSMGAAFGEYWVAGSERARTFWKVVMAVLCGSTAAMARSIIKSSKSSNKNDSQESPKHHHASRNMKMGGCPVFNHKQ